MVKYLYKDNIVRRNRVCRVQYVSSCVLQYLAQRQVPTHIYMYTNTQSWRGRRTHRMLCKKEKCFVSIDFHRCWSHTKHTSTTTCCHCTHTYRSRGTDKGDERRDTQGTISPPTSPPTVWVTIDPITSIAWWGGAAVQLPGPRCSNTMPPGVSGTSQWCVGAPLPTQSSPSTQAHAASCRR